MAGDCGDALFGVGQHVERALVARAQADLAVEARDGFGVVIEHIGRGVHHGVHGRVAALKIGHQHLDAAARNALADGADGQGEQFRAAIVAVVAIDAGDHGEAQTHGGDGFGDAARLVVIHRQRRAFLHGAEAAAARADVAQNHERGGAVVPAFAHVGAGGAFADGVQAEAVDQRFQIAIVLADGRGGAQPGGTGG